MSLGILAGFVLELKIKNWKNFRTFEKLLKIRNCAYTFLTHTVVCPIKYPTRWFLFHPDSSNRTGDITVFVIHVWTSSHGAQMYCAREILTRASTVVCELRGRQPGGSRSTERKKCGSVGSRHRDIPVPGQWAAPAAH